MQPVVLDVRAAASWLVAAILVGGGWTLGAWIVVRVLH
jgi:hypothetical protein